MTRYLFTLLLIAVMLTSCIPSAGSVENGGGDVPLESASSAVPTDTDREATASPSLLSAEPPEVYNFLLLGGDHRQHRIGTEYGNKTDVMLLVRITMSDPVVFTVFQFPRNLYHPVDSFPDMWLFAVYGLEDMVGLHYYFQEVFDIDLQGIAYINMDNFVRFIDDLGGVHYGATVHSGEETLEYLRDNDNNWGCPEYDCADRQFEILKALADRVKTKFSSNAAVTTGILIDTYGYLFDTDLSAWEQVHWLVELGWQIAMAEYRIEFKKVTESGGVVYGDTPLEIRGWIVPDIEKLRGWFQ